MGPPYAGWRLFPVQILAGWYHAILVFVLAFYEE